MLGRLLSTAASTLNPAAYSGRSNGTPLESVTEEEHTSGLLFPDASLLRRSNTHAFPLQTTFNSPNASTAGAYDDRGGMELDPIKDFRVIVAQNALGDRDACVLLDTRASDSPPAGLGIDPQGNDQSGLKHTRAVSSLSRGTRRNLLTQSSLIESSPLSAAADARRSSPAGPGAFSRARGRSSTLAPPGTWHDPGPSRHSSDSNDTGLLNCIFGSSAFSYRGSSTKMHIISADESPANGVSASPAARSPLSRAYTTGSPSAPIGGARGVDDKPPSKVTVLLTRMFSVNLPEGAEASAERHDYASALYQESLPEMEFPFPDVSKRKKIKEKKTPMYAVAITIQIPLLPRNTGRPVSRFSTPGPDSPRPGFSSSLDSDHRWPGGFFDDSLSSASPPASLDERLDLLVDHWDVITRTLSHLERLVRNEILFLLKKVDSLSGPHPKPAKPPNMQRTNQTIVHLPANILSVNSKLKEEAIRSSRRISFALQTPYVVTGQSRWGVWREEGRSIVRGLGDKEQNFFFLVVLTAFLGNHTEWLNSLGPEWYRRRHIQQHKAQQDGELILANRTVIVCPDKMTARRLVFLLAAFLPSKQRLEPLPSPLRPGTSTSMRAISQSPPTVPVLRQESLRRAIERRARAQRMIMGDNDHHQRSVSVSSLETAQRSMDGAEITPPAEPSASARRGSDARSIKPPGANIHPKDARAMNTSGATTSMITQSSTVPVPHFTSQPSHSTQARIERSAVEGSDSLASETLLKSLQRSDSSAVSTNGSFPSAGGRWGGIFSGLWSSRQGSSTDSTEPYSPSEARKRSVSTISGPARRGSTTLTQMVKEVTENEDEHRPGTAPSGNISIPTASAAAPHNTEPASPEPSSLTSQVRESPLKLSVRAEEGVVDVDLPLPGFMSLSSSGDSTIASPKKTRTSVTSMDAVASTHSSGSGFPGTMKDSDGPTAHVAGWLKFFHEDFSLQAVRPYASLEAEIKQAMRAEPSPYIPSTSDVDGSEKWVDVATTLIADTKASTVKRLRLRRKIIVGHNSGAPHTPSPTANTNRRGSTGTASASQFTNFFSGHDKPTHGLSTDGRDQSFVEERFIEEPVMDLDGVLVDAVERVLGQSGYSSMAQSRAPSPNRARKAEDKGPSPRGDECPPLEVPRGECRKMVLGALEEVVRLVTAEHCREDVDSTLGLADRERRRAQSGVDNTLREGIRKWLLDVEEVW
ncbi:unnamed protein product [Penicillium nalgiovense]|uniref:Folliculin-interacting protein N-terminal domain-containing protein n=1 Tax=Penicillium nalgiovense TaxID=60175 RepID=A0A9W4H9X1_PENNA|nr:unnamed protein product [Penicillium nalgiovense]CAG7951808.1 unnamed protein product [Penicillium nalgiovense]CAG7952160.1 unnamed protein product [Penicillium nalgiovense]CAG7952344.1 unnamed protein product [Penicillium nalgiovense]CAG7952955.1 unnamed protein product [Penicillium nalgiovense]